MNKRFRLIKSKIATILVVIMCINSFAAVVGDNDGAAFITKAEFESLKNDFQTQINRYNTSLDSKIDGAIASYISGITLGHNSIVKPLISNWGDIRWMHGPYVYNMLRYFTNETDTSGAYTDDYDWHYPVMDNRRNFAAQHYWWFYFDIHGQYWGIYGKMIAAPDNVPPGIGFHSGSTTKGYPYTSYLELEQVDKEWVVPLNDFWYGETGVADSPWARDGYAVSSGDMRRFGGPSSGTHLNPNNPNDQITVSTASLLDGDLMALNFDNIELTNASETTVTTTSFTAHWKQKNNKGFLQSSRYRSFNYNWANLHTGIQYSPVGWSGVVDIGPRVGDGTCTDMRWRTESQFKKDEENLRYACWGTDVSGKCNVAPPAIYDESSGKYYLDLSESPYSAELPLNVVNPGLAAGNGRDGLSNQGHKIASTGRSDNIVAGSFSLKFPLFYRASWSNLRSKAFKNTIDGTYLRKSAGLPLLNETQIAGNLKIKMHYQEYGNTDSSVTTLTPDDKIKTYIKNGSFDNENSTYLTGYTNLAGTGNLVTLNGTEWNKNATTNEKVITLNIPVKKGDSVWMRIDPLTENGIYCKIIDYDVQLLES